MKRFKSFIGWSLIIICSLGAIFGGGWFFILEPILAIIKAIWNNSVIIEKTIILGVCKIFVAFPLTIWIAEHLIIYGIILLDDIHD